LWKIDPFKGGIDVKEKWIKRCLTLAVILLSLVSISTAACPRAMPELYKAQCGNDLVVSAPGILKNDIKDPGKTLQVFNPEDISIDPKQGTLNVNADGSFVYEVSTNFAASGYVIFYYKATDGTCESNQAYVKIAVSCPCKTIAPEITVCRDTMVDEGLLMSMGAKCSGCRDVTPVFDLTGVADAPGTYPYKVACTCYNTAVGHVTVRQPTPEVCDDSLDNDCDGLTDGEDEDCIGPGLECDPQSCGTMPQCSDNCNGMFNACFSTAEGDGICAAHTSCYDKVGCDTSADCAAAGVDGVCIICTGCDYSHAPFQGICQPASNYCVEAGAQPTAMQAAASPGGRTTASG
jgi:hypothetical protein